MDDAYDLLASNKQKGESFTDVIRRVFSKKKKLSDLAGILTEEQGEAMMKHLFENRKRARELDTKRFEKQLKQWNS